MIKRKIKKEVKMKMFKWNKVKSPSKPLFKLISYKKSIPIKRSVKIISNHSSIFKPNYKRTVSERKLIRKNPWGDKDHDLVPNWIDCKPFDRKKQGGEYDEFGELTPYAKRNRKIFNGKRKIKRILKDTYDPGEVADLREELFDLNDVDEDDLERLQNEANQVTEDLIDRFSGKTEW